MPGLQRVSSGGQECEPVVPEDSEPQADEGTAASNSGMAYLGSSYGLRGGAGHCPPASVTLGVSARDLEEHTLGLAGPVFPPGGGWTEPAV